MTATVRSVPPVEREPSLQRLAKAEERSDITGRLVSMYGLVGDSLQRAEARLPQLLSGSPTGVREAAGHLLAAGGKFFFAFIQLLLSLGSGFLMAAQFDFISLAD